ncbi:MAG: hypothetical protein RQ735_10860 [Flavobacteriaceae bacterium]|nr:hypothetical protein [Flavobacteriaceae bacterium]
MENWYIPITILPGIALLVLSTSSLMIALSGEIRQRISENLDHKTTSKKLKQLKLLSRALVCLYVGAAAMVGAGIQNLFSFSIRISEFLMIVGTLGIFVASSFLILFSVRAVRIRQDEFNESL